MTLNGVMTAKLFSELDEVFEPITMILCASFSVIVRMTDNIIPV